MGVVAKDIFLCRSSAHEEMAGSRQQPLYQNSDGVGQIGNHAQRMGLAIVVLIRRHSLRRHPGQSNSYRYRYNKWPKLFHRSLHFHRKPLESKYLSPLCQTGQSAGCACKKRSTGLMKMKTGALAELPL